MKELPSRDEIHALRKTWHVLGGLVLALGYEVLGITHREAILISGGLFGFFSLMEIARRYFPHLNELLVIFWRPFIRKHEVTFCSGMFYFSAGTLCITTMFSKSIVMLSLMYLALGDPLASLLGILFKSSTRARLPWGKSLVGTLGMCVVCAVVGYCFLMNAGVKGWASLWIACSSGVVASLAELYAPLDDNFVIPISSALALWLGFVSVGLNPQHVRLFISPLKL